MMHIPSLLSLVLAACPCVAEPVSHEVAGRFRVEAPDGFSISADTAAQPIEALFVRRLVQGDEFLIVERYARDTGMTQETFLRNLRPGEAPPATKRMLGGKPYVLYEAVPFEYLTNPIPAQDPYAGALGSDPEPPRLNVLDRRRFPVGGEAYKLYRCRERGLWELLSRYQKAQRIGPQALQEFRKSYLDDRERKALSVCFGPALAMAMERGEAVSHAPRPGMFRLRILAREEYAYGASRKKEFESIFLQPAQNALYVLRHRSPKSAYKKSDPAFLRFIASLKVLE